MFNVSLCSVYTSCRTNYNRRSDIYFVHNRQPTTTTTIMMVGACECVRACVRHIYPYSIPFFSFLAFSFLFFCGWWISSVWQFLSNLWVNKRRIKRIQCVYRSKKTCKYNATMDSRIHTHILAPPSRCIKFNDFFSRSHIENWSFDFLTSISYTTHKVEKAKKREEEGKKIDEANPKKNERKIR